MKESLKIHEKTISAEWDQYKNEPIQTRVEMSYRTLFSAVKKRRVVQRFQKPEPYQTKTWTRLNKQRKTRRAQ